MQRLAGRLLDRLQRGASIGVLAMALLGMLNTPPASGATAKIDLADMDLAELMQLKVETVTVASKFAQKVTDAPASISVISAEEIRRYGYRTLADILRSVRGFYVSYDRNYHFLGLRGFSRPGDYNTRVLVMVNGQRLNDAVYDQGNIGTEMPVDVDLIERVEIMRGPSSSIYGSNALLGVINVITRSGREVDGLEAAAAVGSFDAAKGRLAYGRDLGGDGRFLLSGTWDENDGDDHLYFPEYDDPATNHGVAEDLDGDRAERLFALANWRGLTLQGIYSRRAKENPTGIYEMLFNDSRAETVDEYRMLDLKYEHAFTDDLQLMVRGNFSNYLFDGDYPYLDEATGESYLNRDEVESRIWGGEAQVTKRLFERHLLTIGSEVRYNDRQEQRNYDVGYEPYLDDSQTSMVWALYLQDEIRLLDTLTLSAGLRYDHYESFGSTSNPRLALVYAPTDRTSVKFIYGEAFRAPNAYELYYGDDFSFIANPDLEPETIDSWELIFDHYLGRHLRYSLAVFHYKIDNLISQEPDPGDPENFTRFANLESVTSAGFECEIEGKWQGGLQALASYTYTKAEDDETDRRLVNSPKHLAKFNLRVPILDQRLQAGLEVFYTSSRKTLQNTEVDDFFLTSLTLFSHGVLPGLDLSASVYNLFDKTYHEPASLDHRQESIPQDGRSFRIAATYRY